MVQPILQDPELQTPPASQLVPFCTLVNEVVLVAGWQVWQLLAGSAAPAA